MGLEVVISGGQTGVDQAGLVAASTAGLKTGGYICRGWKTLDGPNPGLARFGMVETWGGDYVDRTFANVKFADATVIVAQDFCSPGSKCTKEAINKHNKPSFTVGYLSESPEELADWILCGGFKVLNVAGNSERTCPGIYLWAKRFLVPVFEAVR